MASRMGVGVGWVKCSGTQHMTGLCWVLLAFDPPTIYLNVTYDY